jgi:superfamily II DNA or RNA helicase
MTDLAFPALIKSAKADGVRAVYGIGEFGYRSYFSASLPDRLYTGLDEAQRPPSIIDEPAIDATPVPRPAAVLARGETPDGTGWPTLTRQTLGRLETLWLLIEDYQHLLDAQSIDPLPHQTSLVEHVLSSAGLERVLIADEVGLGKTIEVGLIIQRLQRTTPGLKVLYLTEARLVENVVEELERIGVSPRPRQWTADSPEARLRPGDSDPLVVASVHKAVANADTFAEAGPWNVIIVDEAHHLTDYSSDGGDPQERMRLVRQLVRERLTSNGRVLLLSGTPHQGHLDRFKNLLKLLSPRDDLRDANGKVIYRIKDDIVGWDGEPLFPLREVRPHRLVQVSSDYHRWIEDVHSLLAPGFDASRASAWRQAQALQWCASSPEAGLAYLARLALRSGYDPERNRILRRTLETLRPYRDGPRDERLDSLRARMLVRSRDLDDESGDVFNGGESLLMRVLDAGADLVASDAFSQKLARLNELLEEAPLEKFVIFAQPIETVYTLRRRLEAAYGIGSVSYIVGGQKDRKEQIHRFVNLPATRFMVSSRSGGEGINLQVARRLVHFDVPWNPMEMEQRVGRVHRYGGARTVIVDTLVLEGSRETRVLSRARARLAAIVSDLDRTRFELLYSRTMALIPLEELAVLMAGEQFAPLDSTEEERLDALVRRGLELLTESEREFRQRSAALGQVERGEVTYSDLESWLVRHSGARIVDGCRRLALTEDSNGRVETSKPTRVFQLEDGRWCHVQPEAGVSVEDPNGRTLAVQRIGLNDPQVAGRSQSVVDEEDATIGAGALLVDRATWDDWARQSALPDAYRSGGVILAYLTRRLEQSATPPERSCALAAWICSPQGDTESRLSAPALAALIRLLREPRPKQRPSSLANERAILERDLGHIATLRTTTPGQPVAAVFPLVAIQIEVD